MDIVGLVNIPNWILLTITVVYLCYLYLRPKKGEMESLGIPIAKRIPIIGDIIDEVLSVTHERDLEKQKKYGRIYGQYEVLKPTLRVTDPDIIKEVFVKQFNNFVNRQEINVDLMDPAITKMLSVLRNEEWKATRNVMTPTFTSGKMKQMLPLMDRCSEKFVQMLDNKVKNGEIVDAKNIYIEYLLEVTGTVAFGIEMNMNDSTFVDNAKRFIFNGNMLAFVIMMLPKGIVPKRVISMFGLSVMDPDATNYIKRMLLKVIEARKSGQEHQRRVDFLQLMLDAAKETDVTSKDDNEEEKREKATAKAILTSEGVLAQCCLFLSAGFEASSTALSFISYNAAVHPECQDKMIEEVDRVLSKNDNKITWEVLKQMTYMDMFILETLRIFSPGIRAERECRQETKIGDLRIPKGYRVSVPVYAIHHDEEFYPEPRKFDPERFSPENKELRNPYTYLPFGEGPRNCIGRRFVMMEMKFTLIQILKKYRFSRCPETRVPINFTKGNFMLKPSHPIYVKLIRR